MNKRQAKRLLNVARALRESPIPAAFTMDCFIRGDGGDIPVQEMPDPNWCGTPACALGHYGARPDMQRVLKVAMVKTTDWWTPTTEKIPALLFLNNRDFDFGSPKLLNHFGVDEEQMTELFAFNGCGNAKTADAAADYIEKFVTRHYGAVV